MNIAIIGLLLHVQSIAAPSPHPLSTTTYSFTVTVWSDGATDITEPQILTASRAMELAGRFDKHAMDDAIKLEAKLKRLRAELNAAEESIRQVNQNTALPPVARLDHTRREANDDIELVTVVSDGRCHAITASTKDRCKRNSVKGEGYCNQHLVLHPTKGDE